MSIRHHMRPGISVALTALAALTVFGTGSALAAAPDVVGRDGLPVPVRRARGPEPQPRRRPASQRQHTFLPGNNQAGAHANANALNTLPATESPGPGNGNSDWSPIWPY